MQLYHTSSNFILSASLFFLEVKNNQAWKKFDIDVIKQFYPRKIVATPRQVRVTDLHLKTSQIKILIFTEKLHKSLKKYFYILMV